MAFLFRPAVVLLGRLRYARKILLIAVVALVPLGFVTWGYVGIQSAQTAFSAAERSGDAYLGPLLDLTVRAVDARHLAVTGRDAAQAGVEAAETAVDAVQRTYGQLFGTEQSWNAAKDALHSAAATRTPTAAWTAYGQATAALLVVINRVSDKSNLTLDPDLDSYYVMDALVFRLPILLDTAGQAADEALLAATGGADQADATRIDLAVDSGALATTRDALDSDMKTAFANTVNAGLLGSKAETAAVLDKVATVLTQITAAIKTSRPADLDPAAAEAISATVATLNKTLVPVLDQLLRARITGFQSKAYKMEATAVLAMVLLAYLLVGFYRSSTRPLQRMVTALRTLAGGGLTCHVQADTRDEVGEMAHEFNEALTHIRQAIQALGGNAAGIAGSSEELSRVSGHLRGAAQQTSAQADRTAGAADRVAENITMVASGTEEMSAAIREIAQGASEAATVARRAVDATHASTEAVGRLGRSSVEIGDVVKVITGIAGQINLLALNASIEAARAGEAGRGFAVVANEVKELSQETAEATQTITARVHTIQDDAEAAAGAIGRIAAVIETINEIQTTIASAVEQQSATTDEMGRNVNQVATGATEIVDGVAAVSRSAEQTTTSALTTEQAAHQLAQTAADLRAIIAQFRTEQVPA